MAYIKSHSNYVLRKKHQGINDGTVYERDMSTIGGVRTIGNNDIPIYQSGNFIITVNGEKSQFKQTAKNNWLPNGKDGFEWSYDMVQDANNVDTEENTVVPKQDYFSLVDFAYYGSLTNLVRTSINDIINRFPFEIYITNYKINDYSIQELYPNDFYCENPSLLDITTKYAPNTENQLHYVAAFQDNYSIYNQSTLISEKINLVVNYSTETCFKHGDLLATCVFEGGIVIKVVKYDNTFILLGNKSGYSIRPKKIHYNNFFKTLNNLQSVLLNRKSEPKYQANFEIYYEDKDGMIRNKVEEFTFPMSEGGYNLSVSETKYQEYITRFLGICSYYDEHFCDNLYRMMTHESIKNFDWTYKLEKDSQDIVMEGVDRISHLIRLFGAQFDIFKFYIDGIKNYNKLSYDDKANIPDYFLTDTLENDGWDVQNIFPTSFANVCESVKLELDTTVQPYNCAWLTGSCFGGFMTCNIDVLEPSMSENDVYRQYNVDGDNILRVSKRIRKYTSEREYSFKEINNIFLKRFKMNSREIVRHKGTREGIEMMFGLFGLRSRSVDSVNFDYEMKEFVSVTNPIKDKFWDCKGDTSINWYNKTKINNSFRDVPYNGLPVTYRIDGNDRVLYPYFNQKDEYDGKPYFQMDGGWLRNDPYVFDLENCIVSGGNLYTQTLDTTKIVNKPLDLINVNIEDLTNGEICRVNNIEGEYFLLDYHLYQVFRDDKNYPYINLKLNGNILQIGDIIFTNKVYISNPYGICGDGNEAEPKVRLYNLHEIDYDINIRAYIYGDKIIARNGFTAEDSTIHIEDIYQKFITNGVFGDDITENNKTNYFKILSINYGTIFNDLGWQQLSSSDEEYKKISLLVNNFKGNNPHRGNNRYDGGYKYMAYYDMLFNHALNNDLFDYREYVGYYEDELNNITQVGFHNIANTESKTYKTHIDSKIHYFGDYTKENKEFTVDISKEEGYKDWFDYNNADISKAFEQTDYSDINSGISVAADNVNGRVEGISLDGSRHQIINTKILELTIYLSPRIDTIYESIQAQNEIKYFQTIVMPFITQVIPSNTILHVKYRKRGVRQLINVGFRAFNNGSGSEDYSNIEEESQLEPNIIPTITATDGKIFRGWQVSTQSASTKTKARTLKASRTFGASPLIRNIAYYPLTANTTIFTAIFDSKQVAVTYKNFNKGSGMSIETINFGSTPKNVPQVITDSGQEFLGWYLNGVKTTPTSYSVTSNVTFIAQFKTNNCTVTFENYNQGQGSINVVVSYGSSISSSNIPKITNPSDKNFDGWYLNGNKINPEGYTVTDNVTFVAKFKDKPVEQYKVVFEKYDKNSGSTSITVNKGTVLTDSQAPQVTPPDNKLFDGWYIGTTKTNVNGYTVVNNVTFTAKFKDKPVEQVNITFEKYNKNSGSITTTVRKGAILDGSEAPQVTPPDNQYFDGWYIGSTKTTVSGYQVNNNVTFTAKFKNTPTPPPASITVYFRYYDKGNGLSSTTVNEGSKVTSTPAITPDSGKTSLGWYVGNTSVNPLNYVISGTTYFDAKFEDTPQPGPTDWEVIFRYYNQGSGESSTTVSDGSKVTSTPAITPASGKTSLGWYVGNTSVNPLDYVITCKTYFDAKFEDIPPTPVLKSYGLWLKYSDSAPTVGSTFNPTDITYSASKSGENVQLYAWYCEYETDSKKITSVEKCDIQ